MSKSKKSAKKKTDWNLFFRLCKEGKSNEEIANGLGWKVDAKSADPFKRMRAAKSLARTKGIKVDGKLVRLHDRKQKGTNKPKSSRKKKVNSRPKSQPKPKHSDPQTAQERAVPNLSNPER